jgi:hypothetical protein
MFPHAHAHLRFGTNTVTYRYPLRLRNEEHDKITIPYLKKKYQWTDQVFDNINWDVSMVRQSEVNGSTCSTR